MKKAVWLAENWPHVFSNENRPAFPSIPSEMKDLEFLQVLPTHLRDPTITLWLGELAVGDMVNIMECLNSK